METARFERLAAGKRRDRQRAPSFVTFSRILIVTQFYAPEPCAAAHRVEALARALARRGNAVRVLCPLPSFPAGTIDPRYGRRWVVRERDGSIEIIRVRHIASAARGGRLLAWASFAA